MLDQYLDILTEIVGESIYNYCQFLIRFIKNVENKKFLNEYLDYEDGMFLKPMDWCLQTITSIYTFYILYNININFDIYYFSL